MEGKIRRDQPRKSVPQGSSLDHRWWNGFFDVYCTRSRVTFPIQPKVMTLILFVPHFLIPTPEYYTNTDIRFFFSFLLLLLRVHYSHGVFSNEDFFPIFFVAVSEIFWWKKDLSILFAERWDGDGRIFPLRVKYSVGRDRRFPLLFFVLKSGIFRVRE